MDPESCFYCEGYKADGRPFIYKMIIYTGIAGGIGPTGSISSKNKSVAIPRSKKAQHIHTLALFIKVLFFIFLFPIAIYSSSYFKASYQLIIFSLLFLALGGAVVHIIYHFTGVKSKLFHSSKYPAVKVLDEKGYSRGSYAMIDATPLGTLLYLGRWIF